MLYSAIGNYSLFLGLIFGLVVCELLKTVSLLKSDITNEMTKHKKLITTKKNCKNVNDKNLVSNTLEFLKFFAER